jgi:streptogramin lyase
MRGRFIGLAFVALAGCSGHGSSNYLPQPAAATPSARVAATIRITIPAHSASNAKRPHYVSYNTQGIGVSYGASPFTFPTNTTPTHAYSVASGSPLCVTNPDSSRTCTLAIGAPAGSDDFQVSAWDTPPTGGAFTGAKLLGAVTTLSQAVTAGATNVLAFTLDGVVDSVNISLSPQSLPAATPGGTAQTATLSVNALDAYGNVIIGSGSWVDANSNPLTIGVTQAATIATETLRTTLPATTSVTPTANTLTVTYVGNSSSGTTFTPTATGGTVANGAHTGALPITVPVGGPIITQYPLTTNAFPLGITSGADGNVWFVEAGLGNIGKVSPTTGTVTEYPIGAGTETDPTYPFPQDLASGPDGNIWFTENGDNKVAKITPSGTIIEYSTGTASPESITKGSDGNLWFTECPPALGSITTSGTQGGPYLAATLSTNSADAITTGPDGNLWFTDAAGAIDKVTPSSPTSLTSYAYTTTGTPQAIASDPVHGQLLFSELSGSFGTVSTSGTVSLSSAISGQNIFGVVAGPDGNIWFANCSDDSIGRVVNGAVTAYPAAALSAPYGITVGPDGNIWYTERGGDHVDRLIY